MGSFASVDGAADCDCPEAERPRCLLGLAVGARMLVLSLDGAGKNCVEKEHAEMELILGQRTRMTWGRKERS